nr:hypothetical protein [Streptomyces sp. SID5468]
MADHRPELVEEALRELGASRSEMREANRHWQATLRARTFPRGEARHRLLLGAPESVAERRIGDVTCRALRWPVPLWPGLRFEVMSGPGGRVWNEWLVRAPGATPPAPREVADLRPWSYVVDEVARAFPAARPLEGDAPTRWRLAFADPGTGERHVAHFTYGLLQTVEPQVGGVG